ncbi:MAG: class I SAM-dependent methyltransferase [Chitinophagaceae bacterium]|nr:class I SAM-dependent methyltransferase [Chitinophagaceae bacterium]
MKATIKYLIARLGLSRWLNFILYRISRITNRGVNKTFRKDHPELVMPPDAWLYETYRLHYRQFIEDGLLAATEIRDWAMRYLPASGNRVLDWGCGAGRIIRHLPEIWEGNQYYGCDPNREMIGWDRLNYPGIDFSLTPHFPPMDYENGRFQFVYGFSVLTHIDKAAQQAWLMEIHRILSAGGIYLATTHGAAFTGKLAPREKKQLEQTGMLTQSYPRPGHRMLATYHTESAFRRLTGSLFEILEFHDGKKNPRKAGGQDLWLLKKLGA